MKDEPKFDFNELMSEISHNKAEGKLNIENDLAKDSMDIESGRAVSTGEKIEDGLDIAELKMESFIDSCDENNVDSKISELEKILNEYPELNDTTETRLIDIIEYTNKRIDDENRSGNLKEAAKFNSIHRAQKKIREYFFE